MAVNVNVTIDTETVAALARRMDALPPDQRRLLWARFFDAPCARCGKSRFRHMAVAACENFVPGVPSE